jgi:HK97 family phage major capsid protein
MMTIDTLTREAAAARMTEIHERLTELSGKHRLSKGDEQDFTELGAEFDELHRHVEKLDRAAAIAGAARESGGAFRLEGEHSRIDPYAGQDAAAERLAGGHRDAALRQLERSVKAGLPAQGAETVERLLGSGPDVERSWVARWVTDTGSPEYRSAFAKLLLHGEGRAALEWTGPERAAFDRVSRLAAEQRAMGEGSGPAGSYLVPYELDPTLILTSGGSQNPLMEISRVVSTYSSVWHGVSSAGVTAEWLDEAAEASDASPTLAEPTVPNHKLSVFVPFSVELQGDATTLMTELGRLLQDGATQLLNTALTTGSGNGQPTGIVTALAGTASQVNTGTADTLAASDVFNLQNALSPRWQANARWAANLSILNTLRQFETANGALKFPSLQNTPPTLLGRPAHELSNADGTIDAGQDNNILLYGDFANFVVSQRVGSSIELIPHLVGSNRRPTGQRGMWLWARYGSDCVNPNAFRMLTA